MSTHRIANLGTTFIEGIHAHKQTLESWEVCVIPVDRVVRQAETLVIQGDLQIDGVLIMDAGAPTLPSVPAQMFSWTNFGGF